MDWRIIRAIAAGAAIAAVGSIVASNNSSHAAKSAANTQAAAADRASQLQMDQFNKMQQNLQPYMQAGQTGMGGLLGILGLPGGSNAGSAGGLAGLLSTPFSFDPSKLDQTPGYQFALEQGMKALNNQNSAQGLNQSGAQQKGLLQFATGLANQTYGDQYNRALQQFSANYGLASDQANRLAALTGMGQNAAAGVGNAGLQTGSNMANLLTGAANAQAAGQIGSANAMNGALSGISNNAMLYSMLRGNGGFGGGMGNTGGGSSGIYGMGNNQFGSADEFAGYA